MKLVRFSTAFMLFIVFAATVFAGVDDQGNPNDPAENPRANACYAGGTLDGKCSTTDSDGDGVVSEFEIKWHWSCGWYLIRYEAGMFSESDVPAMCEAILTSVETEEPACELVDDIAYADTATPYWADFVFDLAEYDETANDCDPVGRTERVDDYPITNVERHYFEGTWLHVQCIERGPYSVGVVYEDQTGRQATITVTGICSIEQ